MSTVTIDGATYTVDNAGSRTAKTDQRTSVSTSYGYDNIYQLLTATQGGSTTESYTYDPVGNRLTSLVGSSAYNSSNEITSSPSTFTYDNNGNALSKTDSTGSTQYAGDYENRLTSVTLPASGGTVTFKYDPFGRRIQKSSTGSTTNYLYDGPNSLEEVDAKRAVDHRRLEINSEDSQRETVTMNTVISRYLEEELPELRHSTADAYRSYLTNHIKPRWGSHSVQKMKPLGVELWLKQLALAPKNQGTSLEPLACSL
jgi:YD repeat-containing protein